MATVPLFVADLATLKQKLRLTGVPPDQGDDAEAMIEEAILAVRLYFYRNLGPAIIAALLATTFNENPTTELEVRRALANTTEVNLVRLELMCRLPWLWMDSSGEALKAWNEEAPFREKGPSTYADLKECLEHEINAAMDILAGREGLGEEMGIRAFDGKPLEEAPFVGETLGRGLWPHNIED